MDKIFQIKVKAMSMLEVMVVVVIMGIIVYAASRSYTKDITKAKHIEAETMLNYIYTSEKEYFYKYSKYSDNLDDLAVETNKLVTDGGKANYAIEIVSATQSTFVARATAVVDFDGDGVLNVWEVNQEQEIREVTRD